MRSTAAAGGDGTSWESALTSFQAGLAAASPGDEVWTALGTYPVPSNAGFIAPAGVSLFGGFVGNEDSIAQRNPAARTRLTGFHPSRGVIVLTLTNPTPGTVVDGFFFDGTLTHDHEGGGISVLGGMATISHCTFFDNIAGCGAAAFVSNAHVTFTDTLFQHNWSQIGHGGAIKAVGAGSLTVTDCQFVDNLCRELNGVPGSGGGIYNGPGSTLRINRCTFDDNWAYNLGNQFVTIGGGVANESSDARIENSSFIRNRASLGGAIGSTGPMTIVNCVITGNKATEPAAVSPFETGEGGGIYGEEGVDITVKSCTIAANWSKHTSAGAWMDGSFENCILWHNVSLVEPGDNPETVLDQQFQGSVDIRFSNVAGLLGGGGPSAEFPGSIESSPKFVLSPNVTNTGTFTEGDLHLDAGSPCVDAGDNEAVPGDVSTDLDGLARFVDDPDAPNVGSGTAPNVDMGALERQVSTSCPADFDGDGFVTGDDFDTYVLAFEAGSGSADFDGDTFVTGDDFDAFVAAFEVGC